MSDGSVCDHGPTRPDAALEALAERLRAACIDQAIEAWEQAGISGLCHEGRFEAAISALRTLDVAALVTDPRSER